MTQLAGSPTCTCEACGAQARELRRGRCTECYLRWVESKPVGVGAACTACGERRRSVLRSAEVLASWIPLCFNCAGKLGRLPSPPETIEELRRTLERERRADERRGVRADTRVFPRERRHDERRALSGRLWDDSLAVDDADILLEVDLSEVEVDLSGNLESETRIVWIDADGRLRDMGPRAVLEAPGDTESSAV